MEKVRAIYSVKSSVSPRRWTEEPAGIMEVVQGNGLALLYFKNK